MAAVCIKGLFVCKLHRLPGAVIELAAPVQIALRRIEHGAHWHLQPTLLFQKCEEARSRTSTQTPRILVGSQPYRR